MKKRTYAVYGGFYVVERFILVDLFIAFKFVLTHKIERNNYYRIMQKKHIYWKIHLFILVGLLVFPCLTYGQDILKIKGNIVEQSNHLPIEFATVVLKDNNANTILDGTTSNEKGEFNLETTQRSFTLEISFIGFKTEIIKKTNVSGSELLLKDLILTEDKTMLGEVELETEKSLTTFKLDKRVFNVGKDLSSTGAGALEVLNNVPSVNVNIEGQISLRGNTGVQMLINGKPSVVLSNGGNALGTITADMIERVEVITNPSAKYEAEGTSGIINIVLKKEEKKGINGSLTLNTGAPNNHSLGLSINRRSEKLNIFSQLGIGYRTFPNDYESESNDKLNNIRLSNIGESDKNETFYNFILGTDYILNKNNVFTLSGQFAFEQETENANSNYRSFTNNILDNAWLRKEDTEASNPKFEYEFQYKKDFENHKERDLILSAMGSYFGKTKTSDFTNRTVTGTNANLDQQSETDFGEFQYTYKLDYTHPFLEMYKIETGAQYVINDVSNDFKVENLENGVFVADPNFTNIFNYDQGVLGIYITSAYEGEKWGVMGGLRLEHTNLETRLENTNENNSSTYTNLFPSLHTSYKVNKQLSIQGGYSKRIYRPELWDLNPFFSFRDNFNISTGNPNLNPEFTDSYEFTSIYIKDKYSLNIGIYDRYTTEVIESVRTFTNNVTLRKPLNIGTRNTVGFEFNGKYTPNKRLTFMGDFNWNRFTREGEFEDQSFDFNGTRWTSRLSVKIKMPSSIDVELTGNYRSKYKTIQGNQSATAFLNLGARKKIMKGKMVVNLSIRDIFASRIQEQRITQTTYDLYSYRQRGRFITVGISYAFGKGEAMEFSGNKHF